MAANFTFSLLINRAPNGNAQANRHLIAALQAVLRRLIHFFRKEGPPKEHSDTETVQKRSEISASRALSGES